MEERAKLQFGRFDVAAHLTEIAAVVNFFTCKVKNNFYDLNSAFLSLLRRIFTITFLILL